MSRLNEQLHYGFDPAGNLVYRTNNALVQNFQINSLNELTANTNRGTLTVMGATSTDPKSVTVNGASAATYNDNTFAAANMPFATNYTAVAENSSGQWATNTVTVNLATQTAFQYDGNGNLTNDGLRSFAYDDENQLTQVWVSNQWLSRFAYDGKMRRRIRQEYTWQSGAWVQTNVVHYVYDGNVVIQERDINNWPATTYTRGKDLSGSLEGAGGIGGLLSMTLNGATGPLSSNSMYYHSDGNGNVTALIAPSQTIVAKYVYDAFGNLISKSGQYADANPYRFSSKEAHPPSGLVYYLYRYYDPNLQRWVNHDPIGEAGSFNLYGFVGNNPVNVVDPYGLDYHYIGNPADFPPGMSPLYYGDTTTEQAVSAVANVGVSFMDGLAAIGNFVDWAGDQLLGDGGGQAMMMAMPEFGALGDLGAASKEAQAMQEARNLGKAGEKAACITKNTKRIPSLNNTANYRVPDVLDAENKILGEVKNVQNLSMTAQLQDYLAFAQHNGYQFQLTVDINTSLSSSVVNNVTSGAITLIQAPLR